MKKKFKNLMKKMIIVMYKPIKLHKIAINVEKEVLTIRTCNKCCTALYISTIEISKPTIQSDTIILLK